MLRHYRTTVRFRDEERKQNATRHPGKGRRLTWRRTSVQIIVLITITGSCTSWGTIRAGRSGLRSTTWASVSVFSPWIPPSSTMRCGTTGILPLKAVSCTGCCLTAALCCGPPSTQAGAAYSLTPSPTPTPPVDLDLTVFNNSLWVDGQTPNQGNQLYKLGHDGSVTKWTAINPNGAPGPGVGPGLDPGQFTEFNGALWFDGNTGTQGRQLYKLGFDGSVTKWTAANSG